jgi:hypothetical protein
MIDEPSNCYIADYVKDDAFSELRIERAIGTQNDMSTMTVGD